MKLHYLEIVTADVDGVCAAYAAAAGASFGGPVAALGQARTAPLPDGATLGVRAPMHEAEEPAIRPYWLVADLAAAVAAAEAAGAHVILPAMEIPGHGTIAICMQGGGQHGYWQI